MVTLTFSRFNGVNHEKQQINILFGINRTVFEFDNCGYSWFCGSGGSVESAFQKQRIFTQLDDVNYQYHKLDSLSI